MPPEQTPIPQKEPFNFWETDPKKNFAPWFLIFCVVLIIIGLCTAGYFKYQAYQNYKYGLSVIEQPRTEPRDLPLADFTGWQTYRNEEYGFEIKYPTEWLKIEDELWVLFSTTEGDHMSLEKVKDEPRFLIMIKDNEFPNSENAENYYNKKYDFGRNFPSKPDSVVFTKISGKSAVEFLIFETISTNRHIIIPLKTKVVEIIYPSSQPNFQDTYNQILSTFKFIEPIPADWKTYRNAEFGFEFRYPKDWENGSLDGKGENTMFVVYKDYEDTTGYRHTCQLSTVVFKNDREISESIESWYDRELANDNANIISRNFIDIETKEGVRIVGEELAHGDYVYLPFFDTDVLTIYLLCDFDSATAEFDQILSTFKFTK